MLTLSSIDTMHPIRFIIFIRGFVLLTMPHQLGIRPSGCLYYFKQTDNSDVASTSTPPLTLAFTTSISAGLLVLAVSQSASFSPALRYWRKIAVAYLNRRCQQLQTTTCQHLPSLDEETLSDFLLATPPMLGAEYLNQKVIKTVWEALDQHLCLQVEQHYNGSLAAFLQDQAPHWHQVGRVCFHLAENRQDPDYPFAFMATYAAQVMDDGRMPFQPLGKALQQYAGKKNKQALIQLLSPIDLAAQKSPQVSAWLASGDIYQPQAWTAQEAYHFIQQLALYEASGIMVRLPNWWKKRLKPQVEVTIGGKKQHSIDTDSLLDFNVQMALGEEHLTAQEWHALLDADDGLVFFKGQWVELDKEKLQQTLAHWQGLEQQMDKGGINFTQGMRLLAGMPQQLTDKTVALGTEHWAFVNAGAELKTLLKKMRNPDNIKQAVPGAALKTHLRPYQAVGVNWLVQLSQLGLGACLADDMGLGKTIQVIALLLVRAKQAHRQPSLLVLPASLINNWKSELEKFSPSLSCHFIHPTFLNTEKITDAQLLHGKHLVVTTYGMLSRQSWLLEQNWQLVILDEAQAIKNANTQQSKAVKKLTAQARIALTGTPVENRLADLWSLFDFLCPGLLGNASAFKKYLKTLEESDNQPYAPLRKLISPYILRRLKSDKSLIADLPDKTEVYAYCGLSSRQAALYEKSVQTLQQALTDENAEGSSIKRRGLVLAYLLRFKQICNHPSQWLGDGEYKAMNSGKFMRLAELAEAIAARQEKVLIFTQFREITTVLADFLAGIFKQPGLVLHGGTSIARRKQYVEAFQQEDGPPFFVLSIKAGGTGLNLTAASHVIHFDRWWNPAVENQATDRAYRIGQKRNVLVHKFVCKGTVEEKIDAMIQEKNTLSEELLGNAQGTEKRLTELSDNELIELVTLDLQQISA